MILARRLHAPTSFFRTKRKSANRSIEERDRWNVVRSFGETFSTKQPRISIEAEGIPHLQISMQFGAPANAQNHDQISISVSADWLCYLAVAWSFSELFIRLVIARFSFMKVALALWLSHELSCLAIFGDVVSLSPSSSPFVGSDCPKVLIVPNVCFGEAD